MCTVQYLKFLLLFHWYDLFTFVYALCMHVWMPTRFCAHIFKSLEWIYHFLPCCHVASSQKQTLPGTHTFIAVLITKSHSLILLPCKSEMLSPQMQSYLFTQSSAHFGDIARGERERERERERGEHWQKRPQTPQMGFQSVLIYLSPWGLLSVVICLCLGWHYLCPSCFRLCIPSMQNNP